MSHNNSTVPQRRDGDVQPNGVDDEVHQIGIGIRFRQATEVVLDEQVAQALLEIMQRRQRLLTETV